MTMFPPIWVTAWASQRSRNGRFLKTASAPPDGGAPGAGVVVGAVVAGASVTRPLSRAVGLTAALSAGSPRLTNPARRRSSGPPLDQHVPVAAPAAQPDVGAEPVDEPLVAAAGMGAPQPQDVAEEQLDRGTRGHPAERIRGRT